MCVTTFGKHGMVGTREINLDPYRYHALGTFESMAHFKVGKSSQSS